MKLQTPAVFALGVARYVAIERVWRGGTQWTLALTGGGACITAAEYVVGCTVTRHFRLRVWDYSHEFGNVQGQICPKYAALWALLSAPIMLPK